MSERVSDAELGAGQVLLGRCTVGPLGYLRDVENDAGEWLRAHAIDLLGDLTQARAERDALKTELATLKLDMDLAHAAEAIADMEADELRARCAVLVAEVRAARRWFGEHPEVTLSADIILAVANTEGAHALEAERE